MTHICVGKLPPLVHIMACRMDGTKPLSANAATLLIGPLGTSFSEILVGIQTFSFKETRLKMASAKWRPFCLGLDELNLHMSRIWWCMPSTGTMVTTELHIDDLVKDCSISSELAMEILQSFTKPLMFSSNIFMTARY